MTWCAPFSQMYNVIKHNNYKPQISLLTYHDKIRHLWDFLRTRSGKKYGHPQNFWPSQVGGKNVFLGGASQGWVEFSRRKFPLDGRLGWAGCGTALHAALTYEGELGGVIGYLAKMRLIVTRRRMYMRVEQKVHERGVLCVSLWVCN